MEKSLVNQLEISREQILHTVSFQKQPQVSPNIASQLQFLINRTDELRTVLKEMDEMLNRIREESLKYSLPGG
jgi:hypothetical protein